MDKLLLNARWDSERPEERAGWLVGAHLGDVKTFVERTARARGVGLVELPRAEGGHGWLCGNGAVVAAPVPDGTGIRIYVIEEAQAGRVADITLATFWEYLSSILWAGGRARRGPVGPIILNVEYSYP